MTNKTLPNQLTDVYGVGEEVAENGHYVCVPCGYKRYMKKGFRFPKCINCIEHAEKKFAKDLELWEKIGD